MTLASEVEAGADESFWGGHTLGVSAKGVVREVLRRAEWSFKALSEMP